MSQRLGGDLAGRLRDVDALTSMLGRQSGSLAVVEGARPFVLAGAARLSARRPFNTTESECSLCLR